MLQLHLPGPGGVPNGTAAREAGAGEGAVLPRLCE